MGVTSSHSAVTGRTAFSLSSAHGPLESLMPLLFGLQVHPSPLLPELNFLVGFPKISSLSSGSQVL